MDRLIITDLTEICEPNRSGIVNPSKAFRMLSRIVLDITYQCSLACPNCNRLCGIVPRRHETSRQALAEFVDSSMAAKKKWEHIYIAGGEPALHSDIQGVFAELQRYIDFHRQEYGSRPLVKYFTNNHSAQARRVLAALPDDYIVVNSNKQDSSRSFKPVCVAPLDLGYYDDDNLRPCQELYQCGMALNHRGYYPCAIAAAIDDVLLDRKLGLQSLGEVTFERMADILHQTCRYCGHYFEPLGYHRESRLMVSQTWERFLQKSPHPRRER